MNSHDILGIFVVWGEKWKTEIPVTAFPIARKKQANKQNMKQ